ncbi:MAG TPA: (2Fe-2S)-binding protein [Thermoanaerobaculia bacterium]
MFVLRLSLNVRRTQGNANVIICICRGKSEKDVMRSIDNGAATVRDLQRCGIGDQCGSCHNTLRSMIAQAAAAASAQPCPACTPQPAAALTAASASA